MNDQKPTTLADVTKKNNAGKVNKFADSIMPAAPKPRTEPTPEPPVQVTDPAPQETESAPVAAAAAAPALKQERPKKPGGFTVEEIVNAPTKDGVAFNKMVRVTDEHHELLRLLAFNYRKPMNVVVHNLIALLDQAYQKEQKKGDQ